jgi:hypothetical protein
MDQPDSYPEKIMSQETLRSGFTPDGQKVFLIFDGQHYRLATRWIWLDRFLSIWDACDAFEALEMMEGDLRASSKKIKTEIARIPRHFDLLRNKATRISHLVTCAEKRINGLRPLSCGSKSSVTKWIPA